VFTRFKLCFDLYCVARLQSCVRLMFSGLKKIWSWGELNGNSIMIALYIIFVCILRWPFFLREHMLKNPSFVEGLHMLHLCKQH